MRNIHYKWLILIGLFATITSFMLGSHVMDKSNEDFWKDRSVDVLKKHPNSLVQHGKYTYTEHYITIKELNREFIVDIYGIQ